MISVIKNPTKADCEFLYDGIVKSYYIRSTDTHEPLPTVSDFHVDGLAVALFSDKAEAESMAAELSGPDEVEAEVYAMEALWDFLLECAKGGYDGVILDKSFPLTFYNRLTDMDRGMPSVMGMRFPDSVNELNAFIFTRIGIGQWETGKYIKWRDYDRLDKASNRFLLQGNPLPEPIDAHTILDKNGTNVAFRQGATFLGPYVSDIGAIPLFSHLNWAIYFAQKNGLLESFKDGVVKLSDGYRLERVNLFELLDSVKKQHGPFLDVGLNSLCHRFRQGWFFKHKENWILETISGSWDISNGGARLRSDIEPFRSYKGSDNGMSFISAGVSTVVGNPFTRIAGTSLSCYSEEDANEILDRELANDYQPAPDDTLPVDTFVIDAFDKISGEKVAYSMFDCESTMDFLVFPDIVAAAAYLIHNVLPFDEEIRLEGYQPFIGEGAPGSHNPKIESLITKNLTTAIRKTVFDALTKGYNPKHGIHLRRLMQDASTTFEIAEIGYVGDLLFYGTSDERNLWDRLDENEPEAIKRITKLKSYRSEIEARIETSPERVSQLRLALGNTYDLMASESKVIAATVLDEFERVGKRPAYDYAGISMKTSKLVERELNVRLFRPWRLSVREKYGKIHLKELLKKEEADPTDRTELTLLNWLMKKSKLDLGGMRFCLIEARKINAITPAKRLLSEYIINSMKDGHWLISSDFE